MEIKLKRFWRNGANQQGQQSNWTCSGSCVWSLSVYLLIMKVWTQNSQGCLRTLIHNLWKLSFRGRWTHGEREALCDYLRSYLCFSFSEAIWSSLEVYLVKIVVTFTPRGFKFHCLFTYCTIIFFLCSVIASYVHIQATHLQYLQSTLGEKRNI